MIRYRERGLLTARAFRRNFILNKFLEVTLSNSEDDLLIFCSVHEILDENCHFSDMFLVACEDIFSKSKPSADIIELVTQVITIVQPELDATVQYIPAEYEFLKFLLDMNLTFLSILVRDN